MLRRLRDGTVDAVGHVRAAGHGGGEEGVVWDEATLTQYLPNPKAFVPGTKMAFGGLKKPDDVANVIAYLAAHP